MLHSIISSNSSNNILVQCAIQLLLMSRVLANCGQTCGCGPPARPMFTNVFVVNKRVHYNNSRINYEHESKVLYKCVDPNDMLIGGDSRVCVSGKWIGAVPKCGPYIDLSLHCLDLMHITGH